MRIAVCDDDLLVAEQLKTMIQKLFDGVACDVYSHCGNLIDDVEDEIKFDIVIMDIEWSGKERGLAAVERLLKTDPDVGIIYLTGYTEKYVQQIFLSPVNASGFLVKPVSEDMLKRNIEKAIEDRKERRRNKFVFQKNGSIHSVDFCDIRYLESCAHKIMIVTKAGRYDCYGKLDELAERFPPDFVRCHKSYLVNMDEICEFQNKFVIELKDGVKIPVTKSRYGEVKKIYFEYCRESVQRW